MPLSSSAHHSQLKAPRDPSPKTRPKHSTMAPKKQSLSPISTRTNKGKATKQKLEVIDLCDSDEEPRPTPPKPHKALPAKALSKAIAAVISTASNASASGSKQALPKSQVPGYQTPPLFRYCPSSTASPSPPPRDSLSGLRQCPLPALELESPALAAPPPSKKQKTQHIINLEDEPEVELVCSQPAKAKKPARFSATTRALLKEFAEYSEDSDDEVGVPVKAAPKKKAPATKARPALATKRNIKDISVGASGRSGEDEEERPAKRNNRISETEKTRREAEKEEARLLRQREREAKAAEKEEVRVQRQREKEAKEAEKKREQELLSVNKLRTSKKDSVLEMIVDIATDLAGSPLGDLLRRFLLVLKCQVNHEWRPENDSDGLCRVVKWRRKVKAEYNEEKGMFLPLPVEEIRDEQHVVVYLTAREFVEIAMGADPNDLAEHVSRMKKLHPGGGKDVKLIYLIEGLEALARKNRNNRNRVYQNRVRAHLGVAQGGISGIDMDIIDEDQIEDARLRLQVAHGCLIHETANGTESVEWITKFTGDISTIPYKNSRAVVDTAFCTDVGQVKTGVGKVDTYARMLEEIHRVTPSVANGIVSVYPNVQSLVNGFRLHGENALENLPVIATRGGQPMNRNIGPAISKRIYGIFMGTDPLSTDV